MLDLISKYPDRLICDASCPLITNKLLEDELLLYNLNNSARELLFSHFKSMCTHQLHSEFCPEELSGGQKVILMVLLALLSPAERIVFFHLYDSLDAVRIKEIDLLIVKFGEHKDILVV